jgi:integrase
VNLSQLTRCTNNAVGGSKMRPSKPWFRSSRNAWFAQVNGKKHFLGEHPKGARPPKKTTANGIRRPRSSPPSTISCRAAKPRQRSLENSPPPLSANFSSSTARFITRRKLRLQQDKLPEDERQPVPDLAGVVAYCYRHSFATEALAGGESSALVAELLGPSDIQMFQQHHSHLSQKTAQLRQAAERARGGGRIPRPEPA